MVIVKLATSPKLTYIVAIVLLGPRGSVISRCDTAGQEKRIAIPIATAGRGGTFTKEPNQRTQSGQTARGNAEAGFDIGPDGYLVSIICPASQRQYPGQPLWDYT